MTTVESKTQTGQGGAPGSCASLERALARLSAAELENGNVVLISYPSEVMIAYCVFCIPNRQEARAKAIEKFGRWVEIFSDTGRVCQSCAQKTIKEFLTPDTP